MKYYFIAWLSIYEILFSRLNCCCDSWLDKLHLMCLHHGCKDITVVDYSSIRHERSQFLINVARVEVLVRLKLGKTAVLSSWIVQLSDQRNKEVKHQWFFVVAKKRNQKRAETPVEWQEKSLITGLGPVDVIDFQVTAQTACTRQATIKIK